MMKIQQESFLKHRKRRLIIYAIGLILLLALLVIGAESLKQGLILFFFYITMFIFARYLQRHGGMGWQWPD